MPPWVHCLPTRHHSKPLQGPSHHRNPPPARNLLQLQSLQVKDNVLCRFVPDYATRPHGFLRLVWHDIPFKWDEHAQTAFDDLKATLSNDPLISPPDYERDYIVYLSASVISVPSVLIQLGEDDHENAIYYISKIIYKGSYLSWLLLYNSI